MTQTIRRLLWVLLFVAQDSMWYILCTNVLIDTEEGNKLFETLLCSYPPRVRAVKNANGRHIDY